VHRVVVTGPGGKLIERRKVRARGVATPPGTEDR
jgi:hypothetical protein